MASVDKLLRQMARSGCDRGSLLIAFCGGIVGDVGGFLAAIYMRGIDYVQVPTTFLAQVDSSVGGKTGVNLPEGKNLVGSFNHPLAVFADIGVLATLPDRELRAGLMESVKAGIIRDRTLARCMEKELASRNIYMACDSQSTGEGDCLVHQDQGRREVRSRPDERERPAKAISRPRPPAKSRTAWSKLAGYKALLHGEAVAWGMIAALHLARKRGTITGGQFERLERLVHLYGPLPALDVKAKKILAATGADKK